MTHYEKLAALTFRVIATLVIAVGVLMVVFAIIAAGIIDRRLGLAIGAIYGPPFIIFGWSLYALSKKMAGWVARDLDEPVKQDAGPDDENRDAE